MDALTHRSHTPLRWQSLLAVLMLCFLAGCSPVKNILSSGNTGHAPVKHDASDPLAAIAQPLAGKTDFTARMATDISFAGKTIPLKGNLRMRRGEVVQMAFTAMGMVEIARLEFTPQSILVIDRLGKQYASINWSDIPGKMADYRSVEALFWNELFIPGKKDASANTSLFRLLPQDGVQYVLPKEQRPLYCSFEADNDLSRLLKTTLSYGKYAAVWSYGSFQSVGDVRFPSVLRASIEDDYQSMGEITMAFTNMAFNNTDWPAHTNISNYTRVSIEEMVGRLGMKV